MSGVGQKENANTRREQVDAQMGFTLEKLTCAFPCRANPERQVSGFGFRVSGLGFRVYDQAAMQTRGRGWGVWGLVDVRVNRVEMCNGVGGAEQRLREAAFVDSEFDGLNALLVYHQRDRVSEVREQCDAALALGGKAEVGWAWYLGGRRDRARVDWTGLHESTGGSTHRQTKEDRVGVHATSELTCRLFVRHTPRSATHMREGIATVTW
eukprot:3152049-Rhodomonas_salina.1